MEILLKDILTMDNTGICVNSCQIIKVWASDFDVYGESFSELKVFVI